MSSLESKLYLYKFRFVFCCLLVRTTQFATTLRPQSLPNQICNHYPTLRYLATYVISSYLRYKHLELLHMVLVRSFRLAPQANLPSHCHAKLPFYSLEVTEQNV